MSPLNETLLNSWIDLSLTIVNEKVVSTLPYNEALICNILSRQERKNPSESLTATDLCELTRMQKSQMNRTLSSMEEKGLITRERSLSDKRQVFLRLNHTLNSAYQQEHARVIAKVDSMIEKMGDEKARELADTFRMLTELAEGVFL